MDSNSNARVKILTFLMEITCTYGSEPGDEEIQDVFGGFLHDFVCVLVREVGMNDLYWHDIIINIIM